MKHVIVIETVDPEAGGKEIYPELGKYLESRVEKAIFNLIGEESFVRGRFNVQSAIAAVHEMYSATPWDPDRDH